MRAGGRWADPLGVGHSIERGEWEARRGRVRWFFFGYGLVCGPSAHAGAASRAHPAANRPLNRGESNRRRLGTFGSVRVWAACRRQTLEPSQAGRPSSLCCLRLCAARGVWCFCSPPGALCLFTSRPGRDRPRIHGHGLGRAALTHGEHRHAQMRWCRGAPIPLGSPDEANLTTFMRKGGSRCRKRRRPADERAEGPTDSLALHIMIASAAAIYRLPCYRLSVTPASPSADTPCRRPPRASKPPGVACPLTPAEPLPHEAAAEVCAMPVL
jgi:hypothetical protein